MNIKTPEYYSCDIFFHEETKTLRNRENDIIATFDTQWNLTPKLNTNYSVEYQKAISDTLINHPQAAPEAVLKQLKRVFAKINKTKKNQREILKDSFLALDLNPQEIKLVRTQILTILDELGIQYKATANPHITAAYLLGYNRYNDLAELIKTISNYNFEFSISGIELLPGIVVTHDYLVLKLKPSQNFIEALKMIEHKAEVKEFKDGFKVHITLCGIERASLTLDQITKLSSFIAKQDFKIMQEIKVKPESISLFNNSRLLELRQRLRSRKNESKKVKTKISEVKPAS